MFEIMRVIGLYAFLLLLFSCGDNKPKDKAKVEVVKFPKIKGLPDYGDAFLKTDSMLPSRQFSRILAIGSFDSVVVPVIENDSVFKHYFFAMPEGGSEETTPFEILVDKTQTTSVLNPYYLNAQTEEERKNENLFCKAYPVFVVNKGDSTQYIEALYQGLVLLQEALSPDGKWMPIEYSAYDMCGNSYFNYWIPANHFVLTRIPAYRGAYKTLLRIKLKSARRVYYSKPYSGSINLSQLDTTKEAKGGVF